MRRIYFIKPVGMDGPVKVGCSVSPDNRRKTLDNWSPFALEIVAEFEGGYNLEARFHAHFQETHERREWFSWSQKIADTIAAINEGSFDVSALPIEPVYVAKRHIRKKHGPRSPERRFEQAFDMRVRALCKRGLKWSDYLRDGPRFSAYNFHKLADAADLIHRCEAYLDRITRDFGHKGLKPVRFTGALPLSREAA